MRRLRPVPVVSRRLILLAAAWLVACKREPRPVHITLEEPDTATVSADAATLTHFAVEAFKDLHDGMTLRDWHRQLPDDSVSLGTPDDRMFTVCAVASRRTMLPNGREVVRQAWFYQPEPAQGLPLPSDSEMTPNHCILGIMRVATQARISDDAIVTGARAQLGRSLGNGPPAPQGSQVRLRDARAWQAGRFILGANRAGGRGGRSTLDSAEILAGLAYADEVGRMFTARYADTAFAHDTAFVGKFRRDDLHCEVSLSKLVETGERLLPSVTDSAKLAQMHYMIGFGYADQLRLYGAEGASNARANAMRHFRTALAIDTDRRNAAAGLAWLNLWRLGAGLRPSPARYNTACGD